MMYHNKLVASIKCRNRVCKEIGSAVYLPFNEDYSILLKNLDSNRRAVVEITIDGKDVLDGSRLVIEAGGSIELKRHLLNGDLDTGPKFRFVERTSEIEETRGIDACDGLVHVSFKFEENPLAKYWKPQNTWIYRDDTTYGPVLNSPGLKSKLGSDGDPTLFRSCSINTIGRTTATYSSQVDGIANVNVGSVSSSSSRYATFADAVNAARAESENGITVKGEDVKQNFHNTFVFGDLVDGGDIVLQLKGQTKDNEHVRAPVTRKTKKHCSECGKSHSTTAKFCQRCGNNLKY